jgi:hypothetical protein
MHTQGNGNTLRNDAKQTRRVTRAVYHIDFNIETLVSIASLFQTYFLCTIELTNLGRNADKTQT